MANYSRQRELVLDILKKSYEHPTAEQVFLTARERQGSISRGTVYRNLDFLVETGAIMKINTNGVADRYDYIKEPHHHLLCSNCGKVTDIKLDLNVGNIIKAIKKQTSASDISPVFTFNYVCDDCKTKE